MHLRVSPFIITPQSSHFHSLKKGVPHQYRSVAWQEPGYTAGGEQLLGLACSIINNNVSMYIFLHILYLYKYNTYIYSIHKTLHYRDFSHGPRLKNPPASAGDKGSIPVPGRCHVPWSILAREPQVLSLCSGARRRNY